MTQAMPKHVLNSRWQLLASVVFLSGFAAAASPQTESNQKASVPWLVAYSESGGHDGHLLRVTLAADGQAITSGGSPKGWDRQGVDRRFFIFPGMSLKDAEVAELQRDLMRRVGRSLVLIPSDKLRAEIVKDVTQNLKVKTFSAEDIENSKGPSQRRGLWP